MLSEDERVKLHGALGPNWQWWTTEGWSSGPREFGCEPWVVHVKIANVAQI